MALHTLRPDLQYRLPARGPIRRFGTRPKQLAPLDQDRVTPVLKLLGVAVLGWFGLMAVVTLLAV